MNKIRFVSLFVLAVLVVSVSSCNKNKNEPSASGGTGYTDLQVYVLDVNEKLVEGAFVSLYTSQSDRDAGTNAIGSDITGPKGFIYFSKVQPLIYYVSVVKNSGGTLETGKGDTGVPIKQQEQSALTVVIQ